MDKKKRLFYKKDMDEKRPFYKEVLDEISWCMEGLFGMLVCNLVYNQNVCDKVRKLFYGASCTSGLFSITIESGMQKYRIVNWGGFPLFVVLAICFISIYRKAKAQESQEIEEANSENGSTLTETTDDKS